MAQQHPAPHDTQQEEQRNRPKEQELGLDRRGSTPQTDPTNPHAQEAVGEFVPNEHTKVKERDEE
jgi:hypothetical protein